MGLLVMWSSHSPTLLSHASTNIMPSLPPLPQHTHAWDDFRASFKPTVPSAIHANYFQYHRIFISPIEFSSSGIISVKPFLLSCTTQSFRILLRIITLLCALADLRKYLSLFLKDLWSGMNRAISGGSTVNSFKAGSTPHHVFPVPSTVLDT